MSATATATARPPRAAVLAAGWAFAFALASFAAALAIVAGVPLGAESFGHAIAARAEAGDPVFAAIVWVSGDLKAGCGLVALALAVPRGRAARPAVRAARAIGAGLVAYGLYNVIVPALLMAGAIAIPADLGETAVRWHLALWGPWWLAGGALFLLAAAAQRPGPVRRSPST